MPRVLLRGACSRFARVCWLHICEARPLLIERSCKPAKRVATESNGANVKPFSKTLFEYISELGQLVSDKLR